MKKIDSWPDRFGRRKNEEPFYGFLIVYRYVVDYARFDFFDGGVAQVFFVCSTRDLNQKCLE